MSLEVTKQVIEKLTGARSILIVIPKFATLDNIMAALALKNHLVKFEKQVLIAGQGKLHLDNESFPSAQVIVDNPKINKNFIIDVSTERTQLSELTYSKSPERLSIFLMPREGGFEPSDVTFRSSGFNYDVVVNIGVASYDELGDFYSKNAELFFETPVINIDFKPSNENYGQINQIVLNATSTSEIIYDLISQFDQSLIDSEAATLLLTGIISETNSFQHLKTTPQSFIKASELINLGAKQQEIVGKLYKNKSLGMLKLWGRVLARLKHEADINLALSVVNKNDLEKSQAAEEDVGLIINEMARELGFAKTFVFLRELSENRTECFFLTNTPLNPKEVFGQLEVQSHNLAYKFTMEVNLTQAEAEITSILRHYLT